MVKILLNKNVFPISIEGPLIATLNDKNPKLNIMAVDYVDLSIEFNIAQKRSGVVVEESASGKKILAYVFLSTEDVGARNSFVAQAIFPDLMDLMDLYINSPTFNVLNHPVFFINMVSENIEFSSILRDFALLSASGIYYLELLPPPSIDINDIPLQLSDFHTEYVTGLSLTAKYYNYSESDNTYYILFPESDLLNFERNNFKGSSEKFFWLEVLTTSIIAAKSGYNLNFKEFENFIAKYENVFSSGSEKMNRCKTLLSFLKKVKYKTQYHEF